MTHNLLFSHLKDQLKTTNINAKRAMLIYCVSVEQPKLSDISINL
jgi:hypothetical protein